MDGLASDLQRSELSSESRTHEWLAERASRLVEVATRRLRNSGYSALGDLRCDAPDGILRLSGRVTCQYLKQVAQEVVTSLPEVHRVVNRIEVIARH